MIPSTLKIVDHLSKDTVADKILLNLVKWSADPNK